MFKKLSVLVMTGAFILGGATQAFAYDVKKGDTMNKIADSHNMSLQELAGLNPQVKNLDLIYIDQHINTSRVSKESTSVKAKEVSQEKNVSRGEIDLLARLVRAEAENEPYSGKVAVAYVVLNRVESDQFPNSITDVIYQSGQFTPVSNGQINKPADNESIKAVNEALSSNRSDSESLFFYNPSTATNRWLDSKETVTSIGNHVFKK